MSNHLRHEKNCENCGYIVDVAYCSNCGQKNTETRQSFHHLAAHVVEDITHYDSGFWRTIKSLLLKPAKLTTEYLSGKRQSYVPPVKLYIFISFVTFFLLSLLPKPEINKEFNKQQETIKIDDTNSVNNKPKYNLNGHTVYTVKDLDSLKQRDQITFIQHWVTKKVIELRENIKTNKITGDKVLDSFFRILPKILFIYMPVFAFWLWLFHGKKRWYFFDHSIYTLHFFTMLLLVSSITMIVDLILMYLPQVVVDIVSPVVALVTIIYTIFYFFRSHSKMYGERKLISRLKGGAIFLINLILIIILLAVSFFYSALQVH